MIQNELNKYFRRIRLLIPMYSKQEKNFLRDFKASVNAFVENNPSATMEEVIDRFSTPEEIVCSYLSEMLDNEKMYKRLSMTHFMKKILAIVLIATMVCSGLYILSLKKMANEMEQRYIDREVIVIE